jgi:hypothetical protein
MEFRKIFQNHYETMIMLFTLGVLLFFVGIQWSSARPTVLCCLLSLPFLPIAFLVYLYIEDDPNWKNFPYHGLLPLFGLFALFLKCSAIFRSA